MWRFVHISDPHLASNRDGTWNNRFICSMMPDVIACLRKDLKALDPDFLLLTGDIVSHEGRDAMFAARDLIDSLNIPCYPAGGNHDFLCERSREWFLDAFMRHLPIRDTVYSFTHKGLHFCVLDPWWLWPDGTLAPYPEAEEDRTLNGTVDGLEWAVPPHQLDWLDYDLAAHNTVPTFVITHYPSVNIPQRMRRPGMRDAGRLHNSDLLAELLARHGHVKGVFSGHMHMNYVVEEGGITHVVTGGLPEFPVEYREIEVHKNRLEIRTHGLTEKAFAARSLIEGRDWTAGEACDRQTVIPL